MREIKFRAWNTIRMISLIPGEGDHDLQDLLEEENYHVMQYTGLKDKNGKEIYEGDILQVGGTKWLKDYQYGVNEKQLYQDIYRLEVVYIGTSFIGKQKQYDDGYPLSTILLHDNDGFLVIGNIYENGDLLND